MVIPAGYRSTALKVVARFNSRHDIMEPMSLSGIRGRLSVPVSVVHIAIPAGNTITNVPPTYRTNIAVALALKNFASGSIAHYSSEGK